MCSTSACESSHPSNEALSVFLHASLRHRVHRVRIKSCACLKVMGKYPLATVICRSARLCHTYFQPQEQRLPFHKRRSAMAGEIRFPIPLSSSTSANERCIPSGKEASRRPHSRGGYGAIRIDSRVGWLGVVAQSWSLPAFACLAPPRPLHYTLGTRALCDCGASLIPFQW